MEKLTTLEDDAPEQTEAPADEQALLRELAALDPIAYDRRRKTAAKQLGVSVSALDRAMALQRKDEHGEGKGTEVFLEDVVRWDEPVAGASIGGKKPAGDRQNRWLWVGGGVGAVAIMTLRPADFRETSGAVEDISELVNVPMSVQSVRISVIVAQISPKRTKFSFRSKPDVPGTPSVVMNNVNLLAQRFGGGGHMHASGAGVEMDADEARAALLAVLEETACRKAS